MAHLVLSGNLSLTGTLKLAATGGKVKVDSADMLVLDSSSNTVHGKGIAVMQPPPPTGPLDAGLDARIISSFNASVTVTVRGNDAAVVALGITAQGNAPLWPGMVLPSTVNTGVMIGTSAINVAGDSGVTLPNGGTITFNTSGQ